MLSYDVRGRGGEQILQGIACLLDGPVTISTRRVGFHMSVASNRKLVEPFKVRLKAWKSSIQLSKQKMTHEQRCWIRADSGVLRGRAILALIQRGGTADHSENGAGAGTAAARGGISVGGVMNSVMSDRGPKKKGSRFPP